MINPTMTCRCGGGKKENQQWCQQCWEAIPMWRKNEFIEASEKMSYAIKVADLDLEAIKSPL